MKHVEKFENFEDLKQSEIENAEFREIDKKEIEEFIQLLIDNSRDEKINMLNSKDQNNV